MNEPLYLRPTEAARFIGVGLSTLWRYLAQQERTGFPKPTKVSERVTVFKRSDLEAWVDGRNSERGAA